MIYAYDKNILMPTKDLYNTLLMMKAIDISKDEYEKAEKRLEDLNKLYGDFYSVSDPDMKTWLNDIVGPFKHALDEMLAKGIDPTRSAEGRAMLAQLSRNVDYGLVGQLKGTAEMGKEFMKNAAKLQAEGLYDPDYLKFLDADPTTWDTKTRGAIFQASSPSAAYALGDYTNDMYKGRTARSLTAEEVKGEGLSYDPNLDYTGYLRSDMLKAAMANLPAFLNTKYGQYQRKLVEENLRNQAITDGLDPNWVTDGDINRRLAENITDANYAKYYIGPTGESKNKYKYKGSGYGGYGGNAIVDDTNEPEYGYSTQVRLFNVGVANLLGTQVTAVQKELNSNSDILTKITDNLDKILKNCIIKGGNEVSVHNVLRNLSTRLDAGLIANILRLKQTDDDKNNSFYTLSKEELGNLISEGHLFSRIKFKYKTKDRSSNTKKIIDKYNRYNRDQIKIAPTGHVVTYLSKDGNIKQYAKVNIFAAQHDNDGNVVKSESNVMYIDLGNISRRVENKKDGGREPVQIDRNLSTLREAGYEDIDKTKASNQTKTVFEDYM